ncbi:MAG: hypothetical protein K2Q34_01000 [Alphaproteobacteria bacterium]|nr:hypothetical protein [Alphaproteobacteria bacterium]
MKRTLLHLFIIFLILFFDNAAFGTSCLEDTERDAIKGVQKAQCELGCALLTGIFGNIPDDTYKKILKNPNRAFDWLTNGTDFKRHGTPTKDTYLAVIDALNSLGVYFEIEKNDVEQAKNYFKQSAELFVKFGGDFEGTIAGRNYNRLMHKK